MDVIVGVDEVGRGCWAGPLVAGAVILQGPIAGLRDSKKLTAKKRTELAKMIKDHAHTGLGWVTSKEVDALGLTTAVQLAMQRAVDALTEPFTQIIIDGNFNFLAHDPRTTTLVHGDDLVPAISAASIIAKVARDDYMINLAHTYQAYGFERHVGYGTTSHRAALVKFGPIAEHRHSYKPIQALL